jgi:hypothetical protein
VWMDDSPGSMLGTETRAFWLSVPARRRCSGSRGVFLPFAPESLQNVGAGKADRRKLVDESVEGAHFFGSC